ncbi:hypothetical protein VTN77DRAFT_508 [Rasamsonia byssochlamydoides]|uniref:uncharacterized protein n=1 Tax=Rasamsonia byssochlamydoides TaxID=89139 RepID=UPI0037444E6F
MSKRQLEGPHADRSHGIDFNMSSTPDDKPQRATAAQMANRKIKAIKSRTRPNIVSTPAASQPSSPFNSIVPSTSSAPNPGLSNGFTFGQSQSFPGAGSNPTQNGSQPITFGSGGSASFNFSASFDSGAGFSNPFANLNGTGGQSQNQNQNTSGFGGFKGSIFNLPPATNPSQNQPAQAASSGNLFGSQTSQNTGTGLFGAPSNSTSTSSTSIFQTTPATTGTTGSIFGQSTTQTSTPSFNLFNSDTSRTTSLFGQSTPSSDAVKTQSLFGTASDTMQTSPDGKAKSGAATPTTAPASQSLFGAASTTTSPAKPLFGTPSTENKNLFSTPQASTPSLFGAKPATTTDATPSAGKSLFDRVTKPSDTPASTAPTPANNPFGSLFGQTKPTDTPATTAAAPTNNAFSAGTSLFGQTKPTDTPATAAATPAKPAFGSLFGQTKPADTPATTAATPANNPFGSLFGQTKPADTPATAAATPTNNAFSAGTTLFGQTKPTDTPATAAATPAKPAFGSLFGQTKPTDTQATTAPASAAATSTVTSSLFGQTTKPSDAPATTAATPAKPAFGSLFGQTKPTDTQATTAQASATTTSTVTNSLFGQTTKPSDTEYRPFQSLFSATSKTEPAKPASDVPGKEAPSNLFAPKPEPKSLPAPTTTAAPSSPEKGAVPKPSFATKGPRRLPPGLSKELAADVDLQYKVQMLNESFKRKISELDPAKDDFDVLVLFYMRVRETIGAPIGSISTVPGKRKNRDEEADVRESSLKKAKPAETTEPSAVNNVNTKPATTTPPLSSGIQPSPTSSPNKRKATEDTDSSIDSSLQSGKRTKSTPATRSETASIFASSFASSKAAAESGAESFQKTESPASESKPASLFEKDSASSPLKPSASESTNSNVFKATPSSGFKPLPPTSTSTTQGPSSSSTLTTDKSTDSPSKPTFELPKFGSAQATNFFAQFSQQAAKEAEKEKEKRKAEDFDSEEEDEAEWERKDAEAQLEKRKKLESLANKRTKFIPGKGFVIEDDAEGQDSGKAAATNDSEPKPTSSVSEISPSTPVTSSSLFGHSAAATSAATDPKSKTTSSIFDNQRSTPPITSNNLFGHLSAANSSAEDDADDDSDAENEKATPATPSAPSAGRSLFDRIQHGADGKPLREIGTPASAPPATSQPSVSVPSLTSTPTPTPTPKPFSSLFGGPSGAAANEGTAASGTVASAPASNEDTGAEDTDGAEKDYSNDPQVDLVGNAGEENEDVVFVTRARALKYQQKSGWETQGVGPLRVLKHRQEGRARLVLRADPSGKVVLNTAIQKAIDYKVSNNSIQFGVPRADGSGLDPWALRVKTKEDAEKLGKALEDVKRSLRG